MNWELIGIIIYVLMMLGLGFWVSKRIKTDDDYFLAGRSLGPYLATFSIFATWFGAETCIGTAGAVYKYGITSIHADPIGYTLCILIMGFFFSRILWRKKITTIPDLFRKRFSPNTEKIAALIMIPSSIIWAGAQIRAFGQIINSSTDYGVTVAITVAAAVVIVYTVFGGLLADAYTDLIQGIALIVGLIILFVSLLMDNGLPFEEVSYSIKRGFAFTEFDQLSFLGRLELWMVPIFGSILAQELVSRVVASKSEEVAYKSSLRAGFLYLVVGLIPVFIGLMGGELFSKLSEPETIMPMLAKHYLNSFFYVIFIGALVSAILSTVDSTLLSASALASHNLIYPYVKNLTEKKKVLIARSGVLISGLIAYGIAFTSDSIRELVETASGLGGPSILVITIMALWVKRGTSANAIFALLMSILTWGLGHFAFEMDYPVILTVIVCGISYFIPLPFRNNPKAEVQIELS